MTGEFFPSLLWRCFWVSAPTFIASRPPAGKDGWVEVDKDTLQHKRFANVSGIGDCSNLPTSKTGAAIRKQAPVLVANLKAAMAGTPLAAKYDGYKIVPSGDRLAKSILPASLLGQAVQYIRNHWIALYELQMMVVSP